MTVTELYQVSVFDDVWRFTSAQQDCQVDGLQWLSQPIHRSATIEQSSDPLKVDTNFEVAAGCELAALVLNPPLNIAPTLTIRRREITGWRTVFTGRIVAGVWNEGWVKVELEPVQTQMQVTGLVEVVSPLCRYDLGSRKCGVTVQPYINAIAAISGNQITLDLPVPLQFQYGYLRVNNENHFIESQVSSTALVLLHHAALDVGARIELIQGCDRTMPCCAERFNNILNFGGAAHLPTKNPYTGDPIDR
uniref:phage BR0599 family protein n=1 Tax=Thaumasiovibrio occultus TaxID=1891184 RepID=UPI000B351634|nr:phage BR0599 family protein [Thaumasiovibrio occultus]